MVKRISLFVLLLGVVTIACGAISLGRDSDAGPSDRALVESWSAFESMIEGRVKKLNESDKPGSHWSVRLDVISSDVVHSPSLEHPIEGILEIQVNLVEDSRITKRVPGGDTTRNLARIVLYHLTMAPKDGSWKFVDGVATMVWSVDDEGEHPGEKAKIDPKFSSVHFGMDLIEELFNDGEKKPD